jgi:hypothetical protein
VEQLRQCLTADCERDGVCTARGKPLSERDECAVSAVVTPPDAWQRLRDMQRVLAEQPLIAQAVRCLPLCEFLELQLELLRQPDWGGARCPRTAAGQRHPLPSTPSLTLCTVIHRAWCIEAQSFPVGNWQSRGMGYPREVRCARSDSVRSMTRRRALRVSTGCDRGERVPVGACRRRAGRARGC